MAVNYSKNTKSFLWDGNGLVPFQTPANTLTYEPFFGLEEKPFSLNADSRFVYDSPTYRATRESLLAGIRRREGLLVLTGEIGTGKTTLCRTVLRDLGRNTYSSIVPDPFVSREDLLKTLLIDFGVLSIQELTDGRWRQASRTELGYLLSGFLDSLAPDAFVVAIIDEAQNLSLPLIEETRILSDTVGAAGRLQIVFVGQPELHGKLKLPEMRQVDQRVCGYHRLTPMSRDAVEGYIKHRLRVAGGRDRVLFPPDVVDRLHRRCGGVPRLVNRVCDRALHLAAGRRAEAVDQEILDSALFEVGPTTLSPTWDSIIFAEPPASSPVVVAAAPRPASTSEPAARAVKTVTLLAYDDVFPSEATLEKETDHSAQQNLEPPSRTLTPTPVAADVAPLRRSVSTTPRPDAPARNAGTGWPQGLRAETGTPRLWGTWAKQTAIAVALFAAVSLALVGASLVSDRQAPPTLPALPEPPAKVLPGIVVTDAPPSDLPPTDAPKLPEASPTEAPVALLSVATDR